MNNVNPTPVTFDHRQASTRPRDMFNKDVSYLYSDEWQSSSTTNDKIPSSKLSPTVRSNSMRVHPKTNAVSLLHHRSKHILICRDDVLQGHADRRERQRLASRRVREERRQLFEENLLKTLKFYDEQRIQLEDEHKQRQICKENLQTKILQNLSENSPMELSSMDNDKLPTSMDEQTFTFLSNTCPPVK